MTTIRTDIALGVMNSIQKLYLRHELAEDFIIEIEDTEIKCHRFIIASCSRFFCGLFRSGMKEVAVGRATLHGIACETFKLILEALYTGSDIITEDNAIDIWHASNQLQIDFMVELCEKTVVTMLSLENFEEVYRNAKLINSNHVLGVIKTFILEYFLQVRKMNTFLELSYDELLALVSDDKLVVDSEEQVLESIMEWIEYPDIEKFEDEDQNHKRKCSEDIRKRSTFIAQGSVEKNSFVNSKATAVSGFSIYPCTCETDNTGLDNGDKVDDRGMRPPNINQAKDLSTEETNKEISREQDQGKTDGTFAQVWDPMMKNDPQQQLNNAKRKLVGERQTTLVPLLNAARTCLASSSFLETLYNHRLIRENYKAKDIIFRAVLYRTEKYRNGTWSKGALHRECSAFGNFGVVCHGGGSFRALSIAEDKYFDITHCPECVLSVHLVVYDNELYACGRTSRHDVHSTLFLFRRNVWTKVTELLGSPLFVISYENTILLLSIDDKVIFSINPKERYTFEENTTTLPENGTFEYALIYDNKLLVFYADTLEGVEETSIHCLDLKTKIWTRLDNLEGPAKHLISFQGDEKYYTIQRNGNVWRLLNTEDKLVSFHFIGKLWTSDRVLHGAVLYKDRLTLFGDDPNNYPENEEFVFTEFPYSLRNWGVNGDSSNFLPIILAKTSLIPLNFD